MLTVKDWDQIRRAFYTEGKSIREIARETGHARRTVRRMVESDEPPKYKRRGPKRAPKLGPFKERIQELLSQNLTLPRKQRWTSPMMAFSDSHRALRPDSCSVISATDCCCIASSASAASIF